MGREGRVAIKAICSVYFGRHSPEIENLLRSSGNEALPWLWDLKRVRSIQKASLAAVGWPIRSPAVHFLPILGAMA
jgi:hypothetical protein